MSQKKSKSSRPKRELADKAGANGEIPFQLMVESVQDYAMFMLDAEGRISSWNIGAQRIKGYTPSEIIGKHFSCFYPEEEIRAGKPQYELEVASRLGRFEDEGWRLRKDGTKFWANVTITALHDADGRMRGFGKVTRDYTERMRAFEDLRRVNEELEKEVARRTDAEERVRTSERSLRDLTVRLMRVQDEERRRLGRELHDGLGQNLAMLKLNLDLLQQALAPTADASPRWIECFALIERSIKEVRTLSYLLYPPMLEEAGLATAMQWYLEGFGRRSGLETTVEVVNPTRLPRDVELILFRVLQEGLTNVHRHSKSPVARVRLSIDGGVAYLQIDDEGNGLSESYQDAMSRGVGLRGVSELLRPIGGTLELSSRTGKGTTFRATVPYQVKPFSGARKAEER